MQIDGVNMFEAKEAVTKFKGPKDSLTADEGLFYIMQRRSTLEEQADIRAAALDAQLKEQVNLYV